MKKKAIAMVLTAVLTASALAGCGGSSSGTSASSEAQETEETAEEKADEAAEASAEADAAQAEAAADSASGEPVEIQVFIAASLNTVMQEVAAKYNEEHPNVTITFNADSSGKLLTQIEEGYACDVFFSAAQKQMNKLEDSIALADGSVPVGKYTRQALMSLGILAETDDVSAYTTAQVSEALGGVEISEQGNVSQVLTAVLEGSCEVGTTYYSDTYGHDEELDILEFVDHDLTGDVIYPVCQVVNSEADDAEKAAAADFVKFITSDTAKGIYSSYLFDTDVE